MDTDKKKLNELETVNGVNITKNKKKKNYVEERLQIELKKRDLQHEIEILKLKKYYEDKMNNQKIEYEKVIKNLTENKKKIEDNDLYEKRKEWMDLKRILYPGVPLRKPPF